VVRRESLRLALASLLLALPAAAQYAPFIVSTQQATSGVESRCSDLINDGDSGTTCVASEPMEHSGTASAIGGAYDFADSADAYEMTFSLVAADNDIVAETNMPTGNTVDRVFRMRSSAGSANWAYCTTKMQAAITTGTQRICMRYYAQVSSNFAPASENNQSCDTERNKLLQINFDGDLTYQLQEEVNNTGCYAAPNWHEIYLTHNYDGGTGDGNAYLVEGGSNYPTFANCESDWCRLEVCVTGDIDAGNDLTGQAWLVDMNGDTTYTETTAEGDRGGALSLAGFDWFHGQGTTNTGTMDVSHAMCAAFDSGTATIGAACEIEGGC